MELRCEAVAEALLSSGRNLEIVARGGKVSQDPRVPLRVEISGPETASDEIDGDGCRLVVGVRKECLSWAAIDKLDPKDLSSRE